MKEDAELRDLTIIKRLLALYKRRSAEHMNIALTDREHVELVNILDALGLLDDPNISWLVELDRRRAERKAAISIDDTLTKLALSLDDADIQSLLKQYQKRIREVHL